jgi:hypothetical protein
MGDVVSKLTLQSLSKFTHIIIFVKSSEISLLLPKYRIGLSVSVC